MGGRISFGLRAWTDDSTGATPSGAIRKANTGNLHQIMGSEMVNQDGTDPSTRAHQVGLDLRALRMEQLGSWNQQLLIEKRQLTLEIERLESDRQRLATESGSLLASNEKLVAALVGRG
jgi:hypothetical protein